MGAVRISAVLRLILVRGRVGAGPARGICSGLARVSCIQVFVGTLRIRAVGRRRWTF